MKVQLTLLCLLYLRNSDGQSLRILEILYGIQEPTGKSPKAVSPDWGTFTVKLDHHNLFDSRTFKMRYLNSSVFFRKGGPIFIFLGGEWTISEGYLVTGQMFDMASEHNGYMFYTEHRYYGKSYATEDYSSENLKFLTTDQALEDVANFIVYQKSRDMFKDSKVVVVGGSYSASMAMWMRLKYPHLVNAAYASSAPVLAKTDFYEYLEVVNVAISNTDVVCLNIINSGIQEILNYLDTSDGRKYIIKLFRICNVERDLTDILEKSLFFKCIIWPWCAIVQYAYNGVIQRYCNVMHETSGNPTEKIAAFVQFFFARCLSSYADFVKYYSSTSLTTSRMRRWYYQTCTEYGFFITTNSNKQPFHNTLPLEFFHQWCLDFFGSNFTSDIINKGVSRTNLLYGQHEPEVTKVVSVYGTIDPWHRLGVLKNVNELAPAIVVKGASHCIDLLSADPYTDSREMYAAKVRVKQFIAKWLDKCAAGGIGSSMTLQFVLVTLFHVQIAVFYS